MIENPDFLAFLNEKVKETEKLKDASVEDPQGDVGPLLVHRAILSIRDQYRKHHPKCGLKMPTKDEVWNAWAKQAGISPDEEEDYVDAIRFKLFEEGIEYMRAEILRLNPQLKLEKQ